MFLRVEGTGRQFIHQDRLTERASEVFADGQDIVFMPVVIPALTVVSGVILAGKYRQRGRNRTLGEDSSKV
jgi:hypothetical protein